jgi:AraC-like DNA-binding protein
MALVAECRAAAELLLRATVLGTVTWHVPHQAGRWRRAAGKAHTTTEWFICRAGVHTFTCPDGTHTLHAGDAMVIPPGMPHAEIGQRTRSLLVIPEARAVHLMECRAEAGQVIGGRRLRWVHPRCLQLEPRLLAWCEARQASTRYAQDEAGGLARSAAALLTGILEESVGEHSVWPLAMRRAMDILRARLGDMQLRLAAVSREVGRDPDTLRRMFVRHLGQSPHAVLREMRLHEARILLADPRITVAEICHTIGWRHVGHFIRLFQRRFGSSPAAWRRTMRSGGATP